MSEFILQEEMRKDLLDLITKALEAIQHHDGAMLRELSDHIIHTASIFQDECTLSTAVLMYALSKMLDRYGQIDGGMLQCLQLLKKSLDHGKTHYIFKVLRKLREIINSKDKQISAYVQHVVNEAQIKKGSRIYEHGISLAQTAHVLGVSQWELMQYIGKTNVYEKVPEKISVKKRLEVARKLFNVA